MTMFGGKLKTWMETHIGRQKKKPGRERTKDVKQDKHFLESSESLAQSDAGISSGSLQVLSSTTDGQESYCTTTIESGRGVAHSRTVNLSSPESAYSTGYSTDGASPGEALHPEYYINIRTGKHYFPSPAPTPTSPNPHPRTCITTSFLSAEPRIPPLTTFPSWLAEPPILESRPTIKTCDTHKSPKKTPPKSPLSSFKYFLKSPKQDKIKPKPESKTLAFEKKSPSKSKKWYKQPFKFSHKSSDSDSKTEAKKDEGMLAKPEGLTQAFVQDKTQLLLPSEAAASPRQRNRIRTNPWIPKEPVSLHSAQHLQLNFPPNFLRNRSCTNTPLQQRKTPDEPPLLLHERIQQMTVQYNSSRDYLASLEKAVSQHIGQKIMLDVSDPSEEDLTLNEMMGTFNESYVYEKETDILSDSDPTDCEDYISDSEANHGGDEDSHDDELDFIDTGSLVAEDDLNLNTGRCSYHDVATKRGSFLYKTQANLDAENRRNSRKEKEAKKRRREEKKRRSLRKVEIEDERPLRERPTGGSVNLRKVLLQKMLDKNCSKSAESSPIGLRRKQLSTNLRETHIGGQKSNNDCDISSLNDADADKKYNELIQEAETMLESLKNTPIMTKRITSFPNEIPRSPPNRSPRRSNRNSPKLGNKRDTPRRSPKHLGLKLSVGCADKRIDDDKKNTFRAKSSAHSPLDPLGPTFRNFSIFKASSPAKKISSSSSDDLEAMPTRPPPIPALPFSFQFVDLGKTITTHCPQSEPVKRKMYTCSQTFDKLVRTFDAPASPLPHRPAVPAFYNPLYSASPPLPKSQLGRRLSDALEFRN